MEMYNSDYPGLAPGSNLPHLVMLLLVFSIVSIIFTCKSSSIVKVETSSFGLRAANKEQLQGLMMRFYLKPEDRHIFYSILKSTYFDYSSVLYSICSTTDDGTLIDIIEDLERNEFDDELIADCICLSSGNSFWRLTSSFPVNPIISKHFNPDDWTLNQSKTFLNLAAARRTQNHKTRWGAFLDPKHLDLYFGSNNFWMTINSQSIPSEMISAFINKLTEVEMKKTNLNTSELKLLICKFILIGSIVKDANSDLSELLEQIFSHFIKVTSSSISMIGMNLYKLISHLKDPETFPLYRMFLCELLRTIEPISTPAVLLNFMNLFTRQISDDKHLFIKTINMYFSNSLMIPTVQEICILLKSIGNPYRIGTVITSKLPVHSGLLNSVYLECPESIPAQSIQRHISFQFRLQTTLRKHRKLVDTDTPAQMKLPMGNLASRDRLTSIISQLESINSRISDHDVLKAYNYPVIEYYQKAQFIEMKKSFVLAIDNFFDSFLKCHSLYHVSDSDDSIIPNLINLNPKWMESFGYFMASSIILQHPLKFRLNQDYFNLMRSNYRAQSHHFLFEIYPQSDLTEISWTALSEYLQVGVVNLYSGFEKAFEVEYFTLNELYQLLNDQNNQKK